MKKIVVSTTTRADYGLLVPIVQKLFSTPGIEMKLVVSGTHMSPVYGNTVDEIINDGIPIHKKLNTLVFNGDNSINMSKTMASTIVQFDDVFSKEDVDAVIVLGDRYETLAVCCAAMNSQIPIIHLYGGEITEGAIDDAARNAITKLSYLHFTATDEYRNRVIQMGEDPGRVFTVGAMGVENALNTELISKSELEDSIGYCLGNKYAVLTFHPVTLEKNTALQQITELLSAIDSFNDLTFLCTKANADKDGRLINNMIEDYCNSHNNAVLVDSLGKQRYLSAVKYASFVIGNSSSGLSEVPSFGIPTINIGNRQKGRLKGPSVIDCRPEKEDISGAIKKALSESFAIEASKRINPYGDGKSSDRIVGIINDFVLNNEMSVTKRFFDIKTYGGEKNEKAESVN